MAEITYKRLTHPRNRAFFSAAVTTRSSLWLGPDHLLAVDTSGYTENYKRFAFRDIQAVTMRRTIRSNVWTGIFSALAALFLLIGLATGGRAALVIWGIVSGIFLLLLAINLIKGPSCACQLQTAVQTEDLPSLNRVRRANRVMNVLRPLITQAQGYLPPEEVEARVRAEQAQAQPWGPGTAPLVQGSQGGARMAGDPDIPPPAVG